MLSCFACQNRSDRHRCHRHTQGSRSSKWRQSFWPSHPHLAAKSAPVTAPYRSPDPDHDVSVYLVTRSSSFGSLSRSVVSCAAFNSSWQQTRLDNSRRRVCRSENSHETERDAGGWKPQLSAERPRRRRGHQMRRERTLFPPVRRMLP